MMPHPQQVCFLPEIKAIAIELNCLLPRSGSFVVSDKQGEFVLDPSLGEILLREFHTWTPTLAKLSFGDFESR